MSLEPRRFTSLQRGSQRKGLGMVRSAADMFGFAFRFISAEVDGSSESVSKNQVF